MKALIPKVINGRIIITNKNDYDEVHITVDEMEGALNNAYQQGAREFAEWVEDKDFEFRCLGCKFKKECESESADSTNMTCVEFILAEWQKGAEE